MVKQTAFVVDPSKLTHEDLTKIVATLKEAALEEKAKEKSGDFAFFGI